MSLPVVLRPEAAADINSSRAWYDRQRAGLGDKFMQSVRDLKDRIATEPHQFAVGFCGVRRGKTQRFPYVVYFRTLPDSIEIVAVLHGNRNPRLWQRRL